MNNVIEVNDQNFGKDVTQAGGPVLVDFYAPWCGPCKMLAPALDKMAGELAGRVKFAKVNVEEAPQLASRYRITGVPTLLVFHGDRRGGAGRFTAACWASCLPCHPLADPVPEK